MNYTCPKCGSIMQCISTASIPPIIRYECLGCGYSSKPIREDVISTPLPEWMREDTYPGYTDACKNCSNFPANGGSGVCHCILGSSVRC